jgi:hypothetical protein
VTDHGRRELEIETKRLQDEFVALKLAIEEAIIKGQRSAGGLREVSGHHLVSEEYSMSTDATAKPGIVGWIDDL